MSRIGAKWMAEKYERRKIGAESGLISVRRRAGSKSGGGVSQPQNVGIMKDIIEAAARAAVVVGVGRSFIVTGRGFVDAGVAPFVNVGMAVRVRESATLAVIVGRHANEASGGGTGWHLDRKGGVIDAVWMFLCQNKQV